MPVGEACNDDGTLKDASEIQWEHSPSSHAVSLVGILRVQLVYLLVDYIILVVSIHKFSL